MKSTRAFTKVPRLLAAAAVMSTLAVGAIALSSAPASATALASATWSVGNNATSTTNTPAADNTGTYTWTFTTTTALATAALTQITLSVPSTTTGTPTVTPNSYGLGTCTTGVVTNLTGLVTIPLTCTSQAIAAGTTIQLQLTGFTNPTVAASSTSTVSLFTTAGHTAGDTLATSNSITFTSNSTTVNVVVPDSLTLTNNKPASITLVPVPGIAGIEANPGTLVVATNAHSGFTLAGCSSALTGPGTAIPLLGASVASATFLAQTTSGWGAEASVTGGPTYLNSWAPTTYQGYGTSCSDSTSDIITDAGPTSAATLTLTNGAAISATQDSGTYTGFINYQVTPSF